MTKTCVVIDKKTNKKKVNVNVSLEDYYKKCGFRNDKNFELRNSWKVKDEGEDKYVSVFAKNNGRANSENKFELPPPLDNELYFGSILIVLHKEKDKYELEDLEDLTIEKWEKFYEKLYGGFEDLGEEDSYSSEEEIDPELLTKEGYSKEDGFVVDSDEDIIDDDGEGEEEEEEEEEEYIPGNESEEEDSDIEEDDSEYDSDDSYIASELEEEEYIETDDD
tara:strand:- start:6167 stop:6829 length:663 start_codon:yes stop_codon:yes gene_type:complete